MNILKHKLVRSSRHGSKRHGSSRSGSNRDGLSVIEVLTSIIVALIGVFGVLAMIPFSVKQTQSGLDQDAATTMARSALSNFEASGYKVVSDQVDATTGNPTGLKQLNWIDSNTENLTTEVTNATSLVCIDPLGIAEAAITSFPFHNDKLDTSLALLDALKISTVTLARPGGAQFNLADARRMFRLTDDLVFEESDDPGNDEADLLGPVQIFNEDDAGAFLNRQSNGTVSWCAIAQPHIVDSGATEVDSYKFHVLVFKDRPTTVDADTTVLDGKMAAAKVTSPTAFSQATTVTIETPDGLDESIRRNDWVMLINEEAGIGSVAQRTNISFARIVNLFSDEASGASRLTLDGPDFPFTPGTPSDNATYVVHLRDVVSVFTRTIKLETLSGWNISN